MSVDTFHAPSLLLPLGAEKETSEKGSQVPKNGPVFYTQNWGHHHDTWKRFADIIDTHKPDHIGWQETGDQGIPLRNIVRETGYHLLDGTGLPGQDSTPIMYNPRTVKFIRVYNRFIHGPTRIQTNGHKFKMMKPKWLIGGVFEMLSTRERYIHANTHIIYNQDMQPNGSVATNMMHNIAERTHDVALPIGITADWNMNFDSPRASILAKAGYRSARKVVGPGAGAEPHGGGGKTERGTIDDLKAKGKGWRFKKGISVSSTSDHDGIIIWTELAG